MEEIHLFSAFKYGFYIQGIKSHLDLLQTNTSDKFLYSGYFPVRESQKYTNVFHNHPVIFMS